MDTVPTALYPPTTPTPLPRAGDEIRIERRSAGLPESPSRANRIKWFFVELAASGTTLWGMYVGSTTAQGAWCYLVSLIFWYALTFKRKLWGLLPLNIATTFVAIINVTRAMQPAAATVGG